MIRNNPNNIYFWFLYQLIFIHKFFPLLLLTCSELTKGHTDQALHIYDTELYYDKQVTSRVKSRKKPANMT